MGVAALVVDERPLAGRVLDVLLGDRPSPAVAAADLEDVQRVARVAARPAGRSASRGRRTSVDSERRLARGRSPARARTISSGCELVELHPAEQRRVDLEVRVLGRRPDQRDEALLDRGQERVLLRLVEAVDLVQEQDRPLRRARRGARARGRARRGRRRPRPRRPRAPRTPRRSSRRRSGRASSSRCRAGRRRSPSRPGPRRSRAAAPSPRRARAPARRTRPAYAGRRRMASGACLVARCAAASANRSHTREVCSARVQAGADRPRGRVRSRSCRGRARATTSGTCAPTSCSRSRSRPRSARTTTSCSSRRRTSPRSCG